MSTTSPPTSPVTRPSTPRPWVDRIIGTTRRLGEHPLAGRVVPERGDDRYREVFVYSYRVIYRIDDDQVLVVAVIHGKRLLDVIDERLR